MSPRWVIPKRKKPGIPDRVIPSHDRSLQGYLTAVEQYAWDILGEYKVKKCSIADLVGLSHGATEIPADIFIAERLIMNAHFASWHLTYLKKNGGLDEQRVDWLTYNVAIIEKTLAFKARRALIRTRESSQKKNTRSVEVRRAKVAERNDAICALREAGVTYEAIAIEIDQLFPEIKAISVRQIKTIYKQQCS